MKKLAVLAVLAALMTGASAVQAKETGSPNEVAKVLVGVPAAELPARVVKAARSAAEANQPATVAALVRQVAKSNPAALRSVVTALAKANSAWAVTAAAAAAKASPSTVGQIAAAACAAAPQEAARIVAVCSRVSVTSRAALSEMVAQANPSFNAIELSRESSQLRIESMGASADAATGGFIFFPSPSGGNIGYTIGGDEVMGDPAPAPGATDGFDPDRYAGAGS